jgi:hypothetical protein
MGLRGSPYGCEKRDSHILETVGSQIALARADRLPFTPIRSLVLFPVRGWIDTGATARLEGLGKLNVECCACVNYI